MYSTYFTCQSMFFSYFFLRRVSRLIFSICFLSVPIYHFNDDVAAGNPMKNRLVTGSNLFFDKVVGICL